MKIRFSRAFLMVVSALGVALAGVVFYVVNRSVAGVGGAASAPAAAPWRPAPPATRGSASRVKLWLDGRSFRSGAVYQGKMVLAGDMGLLVSGDDGLSFRRLTVLDGLPVGRVNAAEVLGGRLVLGLQGGGLARWDGERFERSALPPVADDAVACLSRAESGAVLAGTRKGFLVEAREFGAALLPTAGLPEDGISAVRRAGASVLVGTNRNGLYQLRDGAFRRLLERDRPFRSVTGLCATPDGGLMVGTEAGLLLTDRRGSEATVLFPDRVVEYVGVLGETVLCACQEDALYVTTLSRWRGGDRTFRPVRVPGDVRGAFAAGEDTVVLTSQGAFRLSFSARGAIPEIRRIPVPDGELELPSVFALEWDRGQTLYIGYFQGGLEARQLDGSGRRRFDEPDLMHVSCLAWSDGGLWAGTPQGLFRVGPGGVRPAGRGESPLRRAAVNHVCATRGGGLAVSHGEGLSIVAKDEERLVYALHGLPSNRALCAAESGGKLWAGTLSGLAMLDLDRVTRVYQAGPTPLRTNWVSALADCPEGLVVGMYGGGIQLLTSRGAWKDFRGADQKLVINPNALVRVGDAVLAGTFTGGVLALDTKTLEARRLDVPLPSQSVQCMAVAGSALYVGTEFGLTVVSDVRPLLETEKQP